MKTFATLILALGFSLSAGAMDYDINFFRINGRRVGNNLSGGTNETYWTSEGTTTVRLHGTGPYTIGSDMPMTDVRLVVEADCTIVADGINISNSGVDYSPIECNGHAVTLQLLFPNTLKAPNHYAAINVSPGSTLNITGPNPRYHYTYAHTLEATGGEYGAGIGGNDNQGCGTISVSTNAIVTATGGYKAAGIGGGFKGAGGTINIHTSVVVNATGGASGAGIGGGWMGDGGTVTIDGGTVNANGDHLNSDGGAGIGGGYEGAGGIVTILNGDVTARSGTKAAGIGGGSYGVGGDVAIYGGTVIADGYDADADDIGAGYGAGQGFTVIGGGSVRCQSGKAGPRPVSTNSVALYYVKFSGFATNEVITSFTDDAGVSFNYNLEGAHTDSDGAVWLWMPVDPGWFYVNGTRFWCAPGVSTDAARTMIGLFVNDERVLDLAQSGAGKPAWTRTGSTVYLNAAGPYTIVGSAENSRFIASSNCTVILSGVAINNGSTTFSPFECNGHTVDLRLQGANTLVGASGGSLGGCAAIYVPAGSTLNITNLDAAASLTANGKGKSAGIGGDQDETCGAINIFGGTVTATGGDSGAGIGGGSGGTGGTVTIVRGTVTAVGNGGGAGIGGGDGGTGGTVLISGGTVHVDSYNAAADDIGAGSSGSQGATTITGGSVHCQNGKTGPRPVDASAVSLYAVKFSGFTAGEAITNFADAATNSISYGLDGVRADDDGNVWLWLPTATSTGSRWVIVNGTRFWCAPGVYADAALQPFGISVNGESILTQTNNITGTAPWMSNGSTVYLFGSGPYLVTGSAEETPFVAEADCTITIQNLTIVNPRALSPIGCNGHTVNLQLLGTNSLTGSRLLGTQIHHHPAIYVPAGSTLNITNLSDDASLVATASKSHSGLFSENWAAAIGGSQFEVCGTINIFGGIIMATSLENGAGIGSGSSGSGGTVNIFGGTVTAVSRGTGAGIGGGASTSGAVIRVSGGIVSATGLNNGAGLGAGSHGAPKSITISGGTVYANNYGADADDIGSGVSGSQGITTITGGSVHCQNGKTGPQPVNAASIKLYCVRVTGLGANAPITNIAVDAGSPAIGDYGLHDAFADADGNAYLWMTNGARWFTVNTNHVWALVANANAIAFSSIPGIVINGHSIAEGSGGTGDTAWTTDGSTCYLNGAGPFTISGSATEARIDVRHDCTVIASGLALDNSGVTYPCFDCDGYTVNLLLSGMNTFTVGEDRPGIEVDATGNTSGNPSTLIVSNLTAGAALVAQAGANGAGIGGKSGVACGTVEIRGGIVFATGGDYGAGIGGGKGGAGGTVRISGGTVYANSYGADADDIGAGASGGQGTTVISGGSVHCQSAKAGPRPINASGATLYCVKFTGLGANASITSLVVGAGSPVLGDYGLNEVYANVSGDVYLWFTDGLRVITLNGQTYYCGVADSDITAVSYAGTLTINGLAIESSPADGSWSHDSGDAKVVYLNGAGPYVLNGATSGYRLMGRHDCTVVASNATLDCTGLYAGFDPDGYAVTLQLFGDNAFRGAADRPGIEVDASGNYSGKSSSLVITNLEPAATLTVKGGYKAAGIGGKNGAEAGYITIQGGIISCVAGQYGAGIGGGYEGRGGIILITGGTVYVDSYGADADDIGAGYEAVQGLTIISGGSVNCQNSKTGPRPTNASGAALYCVQIPGLGSNAAITSLGIGNPAAVNYGLNAVYTDASGNLYLWLPSADYTIGGTAAGEFSTNSFIKGFTVANANYPATITNALLAITHYSAETGAMKHSPEALPDGALATLYSTNLTAGASDWKETNATDFITFTNAPAVFMKLRVK